MSARVWIMAAPGEFLGLERLLTDQGMQVTRVVKDLRDSMLSLYDVDGLLVIDSRHPEAPEALTSGGALVPVLALCGADTPLPEDVLRLARNCSNEDIAHHISEFFRKDDNLRRYPRVPVKLAASIDGDACWVLNASMYGVWLSDAGDRSPGQGIHLKVTLSDGAQLVLKGQIVAVRENGAAVRVRPERDSDLVLWLHLILGELTNSPLHRDIDPFGPLFL